MEKNYEPLSQYLGMALHFHPIFRYGDYEGCDYRLESVDNKMVGIDEWSVSVNRVFPIEDVKPYLRSMDSMSDEEEIGYDATFATVNANGRTETTMTAQSFIWFLQNHFDFMGLIPLGLAIEVTEENNPYK